MVRISSRHGSSKCWQWAIGLALVVLLVLSGPPGDPSDGAVWASSSEPSQTSGSTETGADSALVEEPVVEPLAAPAEPEPVVV